MKLLGVRGACTKAMLIVEWDREAACLLAAPKPTALQPIFNSLYDAISRDNELIKETFSIISRQCAWTR